MSVVHVHHGQRVSTTAAAEFLRLLMLQMASPERIPPEQIEVADRIAQQVGSEFTLRPPGVADNPFCFDPQSTLPPTQPAAEARAGTSRYFGGGAALEALARLYKQFGTAGGADIKAFGKDIAPHVQLATVEHLLRCWAGHAPAAPSARAALSGQLLVAHGYAQIWRHLPDVESVTKGAAALGIAEDDDALPEPPETWSLRDQASNELGVEIPQLNGSWAKSGMLVALSADAGKHWWIGVIRSMRGELNQNMCANITVLSRKPLAVSLQAQRVAKVSDTDFDPASGTLAFYAANAVLIPDATGADGKPNVLMPLVAWKEGRVYQTMVGGPARCLRLLKLVKRGEDYVCSAFEWIASPKA